MLKALTAGSSSDQSRRRLLLIAPKTPPLHLRGGLDVAVADVAAQLRNHGWHVDMPLGEAACGDDEKSEAGTPAEWHCPGTLPPPPLLARLQRSRLASLIRLPRFLRGYFSLIVNRSALEKLNQNLYSLEKLLKRCPNPDAVLLFTGYATPGVCALVLSVYPKAVLTSLSELAYELKLARTWSVMRFVCAYRLPGAHPLLYRAARPDQIRYVSFASQAWREDALQYGLEPASAHTIYFGVPMSALAGRPAPSGRLLWVGRMNPGKGLQHLVRSLPEIRSVIPESRLTVIARRENDLYASAIAEDVARLRLGDAVRIVSCVDRAELQSAYAESDLLICISPYPEPVPLVMMEAFAAGLPVIISRPSVASPLVRDGETCLCFDTNEPQTLVDAIVRLHGDPGLRNRLTVNARKLVEGQFSLEQMGDKYDALLRRAAEMTDLVPVDA
jgi:glycosyltransferase involved in cell wall biosynthesis